MVNRNETGKDGVLMVNGNEIPVTNITFDTNYNNASQEWNDREHPVKTNVSQEASGSFEWSGSVPAARDAVIDGNGNARKGTLQFRLSEETWRARGVIPETVSRENPADDHTNGSVDWTAEEMYPVR